VAPYLSAGLSCCQRSKWASTDTKSGVGSCGVLQPGSLVRSVVALLRSVPSLDTVWNIVAYRAVERLVPVLIATAGLVLIGGARASSASDAVVTGRVLACGGPPPGRCKAVPSTIQLVNSHGRVLATRHNSKAGSFRFSVRPGAYTVTAQPDDHPRPQLSRKCTARAYRVADVGNLFPPVP
jgi:hypothetical protein